MNLPPPIQRLEGIVPFWRQLYFKWKSLRNIPMRKKWFVGYDLDGNTFWEMKNYNDPYKFRRIVFPRQAHLNLVDYKLPPQWIQWLRYARPHAPSLKELIDDQNRQTVIKLRAAAAAAKWKQIPVKQNAEIDPAKVVLNQAGKTSINSNGEQQTTKREPTKLKL